MLEKLILTLLDDRLAPNDIEGVLAVRYLNGEIVVSRASEGFPKVNR
jgi:hypothetical protein